MENVRARKSIFLRTKWDGQHGVRRLIAKPNFKRRVIFGEDLVAVEMNPISIFMDKPIAVGMAILDLSKIVMYDYYYNFLKPEYGEKIALAYTDTDSFVIHVQTDDFYTEMKPHLNKWYDTSDYPENNKFGLERVNKKVPGLFKDELNAEIITEFVGLRSKMYAIKIGSKDKLMKKKAKGVKKYVLKRQISFNDYLNCLNKGKIISKDQNSFRTKLHRMFTIKQTKIALSPTDEKRHILPGNIDTLAWGHYKLQI